MRRRRLLTYRLRLIASLVVVLAGGWLLTRALLNHSAQAQQRSVFDKGSGSYFGRGGGPSHNVLPPIYPFTERNGNDKKPYAIDPQRVGISPSEFDPNSDQHQMWYNPKIVKKIREGQGAGFIIDAINSREVALNSQAGVPVDQAYADYVAKYNQDKFGVGELNQCIQSRYSYNAQSIVPPQKVSKSTYAARRPQCVSWMRTGYKFLRYSLVGVPQSQSNNDSLYQQKLATFRSDTSKVVTVQKMEAGGAVAYYNNPHLGSFRPDGMNTSINASRNDVIGYRGTIRPSIAVVVWNQAASAHDKPTAQWILRLKCANPIGASLNEQSAQVDARVKAQTDSIFLKSNGQAEVVFNYRIYKNLRGFAGKNTTIAYNFSGHNPAGGGLQFNPTELKVTKVEPSILQLGSSPNSANVSLGQAIAHAKIDYQEKVAINQANKGTVWYQQDSTTGWICRTVTAQPHQTNNMPNPPRDSLRANSTQCVKIKLSDSSGGGGGGEIFVAPLEPPIAAITDPILSLYGGINSYVRRPKQWSIEKDGVSHGGCHGDFAVSPDPHVEKDCQNICKNDPENKINCRVDDKVYTSVDCKSCCGKKCKSCNPSQSLSANCYYEKRQPGADWVITKMIFKPETNTAVENTQMSDSDKAPCDHFPLPGGAQCSEVVSGHHAFDSTSDPFSLKGGFSPSGLIQTNLTPVSGGKYDSDPHLGGLGDLPYQVEALPSGTKVCFAASLYPWFKGDDPSKANKWRHSQPKCFVVSKKPYFSVENGMVVANGNIVTNINHRSHSQGVWRTGSWIEYNAIANGNISKLFATNGASFGGADTDYGTWHKLTFANQPSLGQFGGAVTDELVNPLDFFNNLAATGGRYANTTVYKANGASISGYASGVYVYDGTTTITGDITAGSGSNFGPISDLNQAVIVVNGDLIISDKVKRIDAWLIVSGTLMTSDRPLTASEVAKGVEGNGAVEQPLVINGPVKAGNIKLRRTYGSGIKSPINSIAYPVDQFNQAAETFRHTPQTYIWSYYNSLDRGQAQTVYLREVAPRY